MGFVSDFWQNCIKNSIFLANKMCWKLYLIQALRGHTIQQLTSFLNLGQDPPPTNGVCATKRDLAVECFFLKQMHFQCFFEMQKTRFWWFWCTSMATDVASMISQKHADITQQHPEMFIISAFESFLIFTPNPPQHHTPRPPPLLSWRQHLLWHFDPLQRRGKRQLGSCAPSTSCSTPKACFTTRDGAGTVPSSPKRWCLASVYPDTTVTVDDVFLLLTFNLNSFQQEILRPSSFSSYRKGMIRWSPWRP